MENVYRRTNVAEYGMFAVTLAVQLKAGGSLAETLQTLGNTVPATRRTGCSCQGYGRRGHILRTSSCRCRRSLSVASYT